jgi:hypothetical protein
MASERSVWALGVVMVDVDAQNADELGGPRISSQSKHSARAVRTKRSAYALACGDRHGVRITSTPSVRKTSSKAATNFEWRSQIRNPTSLSAPVRPRLRTYWTQRPVGFVVAPARWPTPVADFHEDESRPLGCDASGWAGVVEVSENGVLVARVGGAVLRGGFAARPTTCSRCAPHAYALREDYGVQLAPEREEPPVVDLDPDVDKLVGDFEPRFPAGPPSLVACERLVVSGDVTFVRDVVVRGTVTVQGPARIGDGRS